LTGTTQVVDLERERRIRSAVDELAALAERNAPDDPTTWLRARLHDAEEIETMAHATPHRAVRVDSGLLARAEALVERFAASDWGRMVRPSGAAVVKLALIRGLDALEAELPEAPEPPRRRRSR